MGFKPNISDICRFYDKVEQTNNCWNWKSSTSNRGYGWFWFQRKGVQAHRFSYMFLKGGIPLGKELDHLCRNHSCVNPEHLEAITHKENTLRGNGIMAKEARQTHCKHGHEYTKENTYIRKNGGRDCRICIKRRTKKHHLKIKGDKK